MRIANWQFAIAGRVGARPPETRIALTQFSIFNSQAIAAQRPRLVCILMFLALLSTASARAADWPQWRGPFFNGSTTETNLKSSFSTQKDLLWSTPLPGRSGATPVVWGDAVFVPSPDAQKNLLLLCVDRVSGKVRWQREVASATA